MKKILTFLVLIFYINVNAQIITTVAGDSTGGYTGDGGQATNAGLDDPAAVTFDTYGNLYITDVYNHVIRKVNSIGIISTVAGTGFNPGWQSYGGFSGDGGPATAAKLSHPNGITFDALGNLFIADTDNNRIRKVDTLGVISTVVGNGFNAGIGNGGGYSGDGGQASAAELSSPAGINFDVFGNLYIADTYNNCIRKVSTSGIINTIVGKGTIGFSGDGGKADTAELYFPGKVAFDSKGNLYIADGGNLRIRKVNTAGIITTFAGNGGQWSSGDGGQADTAGLEPYGFIIDSLDNLFVGDYENGRIRKINTSGIITTIAGNGTDGYSGDGGLATAAELYGPRDVAFDVMGNLYMTDGRRIRKITYNGVAGITTINKQNTISVFPNPVNKKIIIDANYIVDVKLCDVLGKEITSTKEKEIDVSNLPDGVYFIQIKTNQSSCIQKIIVQH